MREPFTPEQIEMLLGGYATGTLTPDETKALMDAALRDQRLFDALMDEEALRETLADADTRAALLAALRPVEKARAWWRTPWPWAAAATAVVALMVLVVARKAASTEMALGRVAAVQEMARNLPKPEPQPVDIVTPKTLAPLAPARRVAIRPEQLELAQKGRAASGRGAGNAPTARDAKQERDTAADAAGVVGGVPGGIPPAAPVADRLMAPRQFAPPVSVEPVPSVVPTPGAVSESVTITAEVVPLEVLSRKKETAKAKAAAEPLQVALAFLQPDGTWHDMEPGTAAPAGRGLRLTVTSERAGELTLSPALAPPRSIQAGRPLALYLPPQEKGESTLVVSVNDARVLKAQAERQERETLGEMRAMRRRNSASAAAPPPPAAAGSVQGNVAGSGPLTRQILLKIE